MIEKPKRFFIWNRALYFNYHIKYQSGVAPYNQKVHHGYDEKSVFVGFDPQLYQYDNLEYDGHRIKAITILGLRVGWLSTYTWNQKDEQP